MARSEEAGPAAIVWSTGFPHEAFLPASAGGQWLLRVSGSPQLDRYSWQVMRSDHPVSRGGQTNSAQFARAQAEAAALHLDAALRPSREVK